jgi:hypothetical protein
MQELEIGNPCSKQADVNEIIDKQHTIQKKSSQSTGSFIKKLCLLIK